MMKVSDFLYWLRQAAESKTLYIKGCFGAPMNASNKKRYSTNNAYNRNRAAKVMAATSDTFGFDCVCLVKGVLWGWTGKMDQQYGGAVYGSNGVPDMGEKAMLDVCSVVSSDFQSIVPGEYLWMQGHCGVYLGDGLAVECTPSWDDGVQITAVANVGLKTGYRTRTWTKHGKLPYVDYSGYEKPDLPTGVKYFKLEVDGNVVEVPGIYLSGNWYVKLRALEDPMGVAVVDYDVVKGMPIITD